MLDQARVDTIVVKPSELALAEKQAAPVQDGCVKIPEVEWWDAFFLPEGKSTFPEKVSLEDDVDTEKITHYVQHPVPLKNKLVEADEKRELPVFLTTEEKKKLSRRHRLAKE